ncbi:MAG: FAD-binding oxidoreductase [Rubrobacteraceae bacterium]
MTQASGRPQATGRTRRIAVIGAGVVGASIAFRLAQSEEARVFIIDRSRPGSGTTSASFAWANANEKTPRDYFELNRAGLEEHYRLRDELSGGARAGAGAPWFHPEGNLEWAGDAESLERLERRVERLRSWGYAAEWRKASWINEYLEPNVAFPSPETPVAFFPEEAWVDAPRLANSLVEHAREAGAEMRFGATVEGIEAEGGRVSALRFDSGERLPVDAVVNAAGPEADRVAALLGRRLPLDPSKGLILRVTAGSPVGRLIHSQHVNLRPDGPGHIAVNHSSIDRELGSDDARVEDSLPYELLERARAVVPALESAKIEGVRIGVRPMPVDGLTCVGAVPEFPGYYEAVTHSGVTLGPLLGRLLAREILDGEVDELIGPFRPDRSAW